MIAEITEATPWSDVVLILGLMVFMVIFMLVLWR